MKTTNFENSKKLAEIGFKADTKNWWMLSAFNEPTHQLKTYNRFEDYVGDNYRAYDLETILEALPKTLTIDERRPTICHIKLKIFFDVDGKNYIGYQSFEGFHPKLTLEQGNESLVDTAARLLIALHEADLINFNK
jgi:hypothetical protein